MTSLSPQRTTSNLSTSAISSSIDPEIEERLSSLLTSPTFSVSKYLNLALKDDNEHLQSSISPEEYEQQLEQRMASLALQLQMRTQSCHDEIGRIGAELQAIVPRCAGDVGRLQVGLEGMELDVRGLLEGMDGNNNNNSSSSSNKKGDGNGADISGGLISSEQQNRMLTMSIH